MGRPTKAQLQLQHARGAGTSYAAAKAKALAQPPQPNVKSRSWKQWRREYVLDTDAAWQRFCDTHVAVSALAAHKDGRRLLALCAGHTYDVAHLLDDTSAVTVLPRGQAFMITRQVNGTVYIMAIYSPAPPSKEGRAPRPGHCADPLLLQGLERIAKMNTKRSKDRADEPFGVAGFRLAPTNGHPYNVLGQKKADTDGVASRTAMMLWNRAMAVLLGYAELWSHLVLTDLVDIQQEAHEAILPRLHAAVGPTSVAPPSPLMAAHVLPGTLFTGISSVPDCSTAPHLDNHNDNAQGCGIFWQDNTTPGTWIKGGTFWVTTRLCFPPVSGGVLFLDTRLMPHCTEASRAVCERDGKEEPAGSGQCRFSSALFVHPRLLREGAVAEADATARRVEAKAARRKAQPTQAKAAKRKAQPTQPTQAKATKRPRRPC